MQSTSVTTAPIDFLWLELTNGCNLNCVHCYSDSSPESFNNDILQGDDYLRVIREAFELGCRKIQFIGGEPTLNPHLPKLIESAGELGYEFIEVFSNLIGLKDNVLDAILSRKVHIATSIYGDTAEVHNAVTGNPNSFSRTIANIKKLRTSGVPVRAAFVEMAQNKGLAAQTMAFIAAVGAKPGYDKARNFGRANESDGFDIKQLCGNCAGGTLRVGPDGAVSPCIMSRGCTVGNVLSMSLKSILQSNGIKALRNDIYQQVVKPRKQSGMQADFCAPDAWQVKPEFCAPDAWQAKPEFCAPDAWQAKPEFCAPDAWRELEMATPANKYNLQSSVKPNHR